MYKLDKRLTEIHRTEKENEAYLKYSENLDNCEEKLELFEVEHEPSELLKRVQTKKAVAQQKEENLNEAQTAQQDE